MPIVSESARSKYQTLRSRLLDRGFTLRKFALKRGYNVQTVYDAARGDRNGIISKRIRKELEGIIHG